MRKILITSVGSGVGNAIITAAEVSSYKYYIIGLNSIIKSAGSFRCDVNYTIPETKNEIKFINRLNEIIKLEKPDLVLVGRDLDSIIISKHISKIEKTKTRIICGDFNACQIPYNKYKSYKFCTKNNLPFVQTKLLSELSEKDVEEMTFPKIIKPISGNASVGIEVVYEKEELIKKRKNTNFIIQDFLRNTSSTFPFSKIVQENEYSGQVIIGENQELFGSFLSVNKLKNGLPIKIETTEDPAFSQLVLRYGKVFSKIGLRGGLNIQALKDKNGKLTVFELNARCTGITGLRAIMGFNEIDIIYENYINGNGCPYYKIPGSGLVGCAYTNYSINQHKNK